MWQEVAPKTAPVKPRVLSAVTGEVLLFEDVAHAHADRNRTHLEVLGQSGAGKSTALAHLAASPAADRFVIVDDFDKQHIPSVPSGRVFVFARRAVQSESDQAFRLASWTNDDLIEYLLSVHPSQCQSIMQRFCDAVTGTKLSGNPQLVCMVADEMARDQQLSVDEAFEAALEHRVDSARLRYQAGRYAMSRLMERKLDNAAVRELEASPDLFRTLSLRSVQTYFGVEHLFPKLAEEPRFPRLLPRDFVEALAARVKQDPALLEMLKSEFKKKTRVSRAMLASLLHFADPSWQPQRASSRKLLLSNGYFENALWSECDLSRVHFDSADLRWANLSLANLSHANFKDARLAHAHLASACLKRANCGNADFSSANLRCADLSHANFLNADLRQARLTLANAKEVTFCGASLVGADLGKGVFDRANCVDADFTDANLKAASFQNAILVDVKFRGANLDIANFQGSAILSNFEAATMRGVNFDGCSLGGSLFTGSVMSGVRMRKARLVGCGLADIQWERADLREADLSHCAFHLGSSRSGLVGSYYPSHGTRTGFYTDEFDNHLFKAPEQIRKANLRYADLRQAKVAHADFYLVDLRGAKYDAEQEKHFRKCKAILDDWNEI